MMGHDYYRTNSVDEFVAQVRARVAGGRAPASYARLTKAMNRIGVVGEQRWDVVFQAILDGQLEVWTVEGRLNTLATSLAARDITAVTSILPPGSMATSCNPAESLTRREAGGILGTSEANICALTGDGHLPKNLTVEAVEAFSRRFMLTAEVTRLMNFVGLRARDRDVRSLLAERNIEPVAQLRYGSKLLWSQPDVVTSLKAAAG
jgi:hypothetical protein